MKQTFYFAHDFHARNDRKLSAVLMKLGTEGVGIYWCVVEMLYEESGYMTLSECERIAFELRTDQGKVESVIKNFHLFKIDGTKFYSDSILRRLAARNEKKEKARLSALHRWPEKTRQNANAMRTQCERNAIKERKGKERKEKEIKRKEKDMSHKATHTQFTPPSIQEVETYIKDKGYNINAKKWWHFYNSKNWMVGKNKMTKWHSAIATWAEPSNPVPDTAPSKYDGIGETLYVDGDDGTR